MLSLLLEDAAVEDHRRQILRKRGPPLKTKKNVSVAKCTATKKSDAKNRKIKRTRMQNSAAQNRKWRHAP